jgi:hypothetical protein
MAVRNLLNNTIPQDFADDYEPMQFFSYTDDYEVIYDEWEEDWDLLNPKHLAGPDQIDFDDLDPEDEDEDSIFPIELQ